MGRAKLEDLESLHRKLAKALIEKIESGDATASDFAVAAKLLRDNGVALQFPSEPLYEDDMGNVEITEHMQNLLSRVPTEVEQ